MVALLLAAVASIAVQGQPAATPIDAERAFAADAQSLGQWTAFRKWSTADALMFDPQPANAHTLLKGAKDPSTAVFWWPGRSYVSCDGTHAVNTGPWVRQGGKSVGFFTTVWKRTAEGWRWIYDAGGGLDEARGEGGDIKPRAASCGGKPVTPTGLGTRPADGYKSGSGSSPDGTLAWSWTVGPKGDRIFRAQLWNGSGFETVVHDQVAAPAQ